MMVNSVNDIFKQAHQGSVAAIIQVLNDKLTDVGVRTRAMFANGSLQLLCEANTPEQLEQSILAERIQQILETIEPRGIRRVNIYSRIVREQQLLWLDEITREPEHLLWSQQITLSRPNILKRAIEDLQSVVGEKSEPKMVSLQSMREQQQFNRGIWQGLGLGIALLLGGFGLYQLWSGRSASAPQAVQPNPAANTSSGQPTSPPAPSNSPGATAPSPPKSDAFGEAVRLAEKASIASQSAQTPEQWQAVAELWGKASTLMAEVPANHPRYEIARDRTVVYGKNQASAAEKVIKN
jgi:hypothetical protein